MPGPRFQTVTRWLPMPVAAGLAVFAPSMDNYSLYVASLTGVYIVFAIGYNLLMGYAGQFDFGQAAFLAIGAYASALLQTKLGLPLYLALPLAGLITVCFGLFIGIIVLRMEGFYLALVTLGFNQTVVLGIGLWSSLTGGYGGTSVPQPSFGALGASLSMFYVVLVTSLLLLLAARNIAGSRIGLAFMCIRERDLAAEAMGVNLTLYRVMAYCLSAFYGGVAGGLLAMLLSYITPEGFGLTETLKVLTMITVGGMGSVAGSVIGATVLTLTGELMRFSSANLEIGNGLLLLLFIMLMPQGVWGLVKRTRIGSLSIRRLASG